jgi:hypothetical protein
MTQKKRGRPTTKPDGTPLTKHEKYRAASTHAERKVTYALFDPALVPDGAIGIVHRCALVGTAVGCSWRSVERETGLRAVALGSLYKRQRKWVEGLGKETPDDGVRAVEEV